MSSPDGAEREVPATKLIVNNVPLSFSDDEIFQAVKSMNVNVRSKLIAERDRDKNGKTHSLENRETVSLYRCAVGTTTKDCRDRTL